MISKGIRVSFLDNKVLKWIVVIVAHTHEYYKAIKLYTLNG